MPKKIPADELNAILKLLSMFLVGASFGEIIKLTPSTTAPREVQRRLIHLVKKMPLNDYKDLYLLF